MKPQLLGNITLIKFSGISYFGSKIQVIVNKAEGISLEVKFKRDGAPFLGVMNINTKEPIALNRKIIFPLKSHLVIKRSSDK